MIVFDATVLNVPFGIAAYCYAHYARFNHEGKECAEW
jgi:hypothetical protein